MTYRVLTNKYEVDVCFLSTLNYMVANQSKNEVYIIDNETDVSKYNLIEKEYAKRFNVFALCVLEKPDNEPGLNCVINLDILSNVVFAYKDEFNIFGELNKEQKLSVELCIKFINALYRTSIVRCKGNGLEIPDCIDRVKCLYDFDDNDHDNKLVLNCIKIK